MGCYELIVSVNCGHEGRVARDLLDLLFPYDNSVTLRERGRGKVILATCMSIDLLGKILRKYPIRHMLKVKVVRKKIAKSNIEEIIEEIISFFTVNRAPLRKLSVRLGRLRGWRQAYYRYILEQVKKEVMLLPEGSTYTVELGSEGEVLIAEVIYTASSARVGRW
jgi:hypothetical protein